jgi:GPI-anchor transamidase subunit T
MALDVRPVCDDDGGECFVEMVQNVDMVIDVERSIRRNGNSYPLRLCVEPPRVDLC